LFDAESDSSRDEGSFYRVGPHGSGQNEWCARVGPPCRRPAAPVMRMGHGEGNEGAGPGKFGPYGQGESFFSFLFPFLFQIQIFKPISNFCIDFEISNLKYNPNVNINPTICNIITYSPSYYLIMERII
jgi:hypothetical protein